MRPPMAFLLAAAWLGGCASGPTGTGDPAPEPGADPDHVLRPFEGIVVRPELGQVEVDGWSCLEYGWLEQIACTPRTREHEALVVVRPRPSEIHAALLLAGLQPGRPGRWRFDELTEDLEFTPPVGDPVEISVRYERDGETIEEPIRLWIEDGNGDAAFPADPWIFAGSIFAENPDTMEPGEHYVADMSGSVVGLVTFGDEVLAFAEVLADQESLQPPQWQVRHEHVPAIGTPVTLILHGPK